MLSYKTVIAQERLIEPRFGVVLKRVPMIIRVIGDVKRLCFSQTNCSRRISFLIIEFDVKKKKESKQSVRFVFSCDDIFGQEPRLT